MEQPLLAKTFAADLARHGKIRKKSGKPPEYSRVGAAEHSIKYLQETLSTGGDRKIGETLSRRTLKTYRQTLKESVKKLNVYTKQREIMGKHNRYSKTGRDATFMRTKDQTLKAAYNAQIAVEGEYITGAGLRHGQRRDDLQAVFGTPTRSSSSTQPRKLRLSCGYGAAGVYQTGELRTDEEGEVQERHQ
ncbi:MAG: hypothetical protein LBB98_03985 [Treponema sp.]|nr:hypothetical protein [Treponema sp.]